jgi:succinoglycan biosynthesis transport protein ExoP
VSHIEQSQLISANQPLSPTSGGIGPTIDLVVAFLRRRYLIVTVGLFLGAAFAGIYLYAFAAPFYTGSAVMIIETRRPQLQQFLVDDAPTDAAWVDSQIGVLMSRSVAAYVVQQLKLADDNDFLRNDFLPPDTGPIGKLLVRFGWDSPPPETEEARVEAAIAKLGERLSIHRIGLSFLIRIDFRSHKPEQAAKIANAMIDGYIFDQLNAKYQANRRAGDWLQERLQTLREQAAAAESAVVEFKAKNNIVAAGGTLINETELSDISAQLAGARAKTSELQARLNRVEAVRQAYHDQAGTEPDPTVSDVLTNSVLATLVARYLEATARERDFAAKYGALGPPSGTPDHLAVINVRIQIHNLRGQIYDELGQIREAYKSDLEIAQKRVSELQTSLNALISQSSDTNKAQVTLFGLEASAKSYRKLYDDFLQRYTESVQQQTFPISEARAISAASVRQTYPWPLFTWVLSILAGTALGVGSGALRDILDRGFRTREQVRTAIDADCLALVPRFESLSRPARGARLISARGARLISAQGDGPRTIRSTSPMLRMAVDFPASAYADAIRAIKLDLDRKGTADAEYRAGSRVVGLTSCLSGEGKSTLAAGMATLIARSGRRVILVDGDVRNRALTRALAPDARHGLLDVISRRVPITEALWNDPVTNMTFLPTARNPDLGNPADLLASEDAREFFATLRLSYDYVIVDLAPLISEVDIRAMSPLIESYVLVIKWGKTKIDMVKYALRHTPTVQEHLVGAVLNNVQVRALRRYDGYGANYYGYGRAR